MSHQHSIAPAIWLLDLDGPLNASRSGWGAAPKGFSVSTPEKFYRIKFEPQVSMRISSLHRSGLVEARWCTSWVDYARELERGMSLPELACAIKGPFISVRALTEAKREAALEVVRSGQRLVWTDDEAIPVDGPERDELDRASALLIAPSPSRGLRPEHMQQISDFIGAGQESPS